MTFVNLAADPVLAEVEAVNKVACLWLHNWRTNLMTKPEIDRKLAAMPEPERGRMVEALNRNKKLFKQGA
ncbi:hypothetical protein [Rheinheimera soli]|uniref:Uncharacterized protein n=1 Tax=Rheinheimera soli TaxID=443616 RepID=A0ABU1VWI4_9GAMM|nr:hypothetical protein [Rheinheimera soli]MDR7119738.1 hypothetical protein [Rheinheimera soli]